MLREREVPDWMKMPVQLQHEFFREAEEEAHKCRERLLERSKRLEELRQYIKTEMVPDSDEWRGWRVAVVDGSNSPVTSERLGSRYGVFSAGYMIFEETQCVDEGYASGRFGQEQTGSQDVAQKILSMLRVNLERDIALRCLEDKDVDLILLDGSFFGFRVEALMISDEIVNVGGFEKGVDLTIAVRNKTLKLLKSGKTVGVIKRTRTNALDGWLIHRHADEDHCIGSNDKHILSSLLPIGHWFAYEWLFPTPLDFNYYTRFQAMYRYLVLQKKSVRNMDTVYIKTQNSVRRGITKSLKYGAWELILRTARYYVRCSHTAPCEFEAKLGFDVKPLLAYFVNFHNPATGLPWPLDLVDSNVSMPRGFTKEFVDEVEAQLIRDPEVSDKMGIQEYFSYLNPQKEEEG